MKYIIDIETLLSALVYYDHETGHLNLPHPKELHLYDYIDLDIERNKKDKPTNLILKFVKKD